MAKTKRYVTLTVPAAAANAVKAVIAEFHKAEKPRPIKRQLRLSNADFKKGQEIVRAHCNLGDKRDKWLDKLYDEQNRLEDLSVGIRSKGDTTWLNKQLGILDTAIEYAEDA